MRDIDDDYDIRTMSFWLWKEMLYERLGVSTWSQFSVIGPKLETRIGVPRLLILGNLNRESASAGPGNWVFFF